MAMLTVRNIDENLKSQLRIRAAENGCSMEEEVRRILRTALAFPAAAPSQGSRIGTRLHQQIKTLSGGIELELPTRSAPRSAPDLDSSNE